MTKQNLNLQGNAKIPMKNEHEISLYQQSDFPIFQNKMYDSREEAIDCPKGQIAIVQNGKTGLVYNSKFHPELMVYDSAYQNEQGVSPKFINHMEGVAEIIEANIAKSALAEIGCGKGLFLEMLIARGYDAVGFDPTYEGSNTKVKHEYFSSTYGKTYDGFVLRHVLEHVQDPLSLLKMIRDANHGGGKIYIEVPCLDWIVQKNSWYDIFYEHVNYFRLDDFRRMFGYVIECGRLFGGQYLYVVADLASLRDPVIDGSDLLDSDSFVKFDASTLRHNQTKQTAIWGGASKGVIFSLMAQRNGINFETVIDINPAKQSKFLAATGLKVISPEEAYLLLPQGSNIFVMNSNYLPEIKTMSKNAFHYISIEDRI
jgi:SAM-dependent methyltransferase